MLKLMIGFGVLATVVVGCGEPTPEEDSVAATPDDPNVWEVQHMSPGTPSRIMTLTKSEAAKFRTGLATKPYPAPTMSPEPIDYEVLGGHGEYAQNRIVTCEALFSWDLYDDDETDVKLITNQYIWVLRGAPIGADVSKPSDGECEYLVAILENLLDDDGMFCGLVEANPEEWR